MMSQDEIPAASASNKDTVMVVWSMPSSVAQSRVRGTIAIDKPMEIQIRSVNSYFDWGLNMASTAYPGSKKIAALINMIHRLDRIIGILYAALGRKYRSKFQT
jgi:hypothetical protein